MAPRLRPPPEQSYPIDAWKVIERGLPGRDAGRLETILALSNGYLGIRGAYDQGSPVRDRGTFINGYYESWPIVYPEAAYGFATSGQTMVHVPDGTTLQLSLGEEPLRLADASVVERTLDMASGVLTTDVVWQTDGGRLRVQSRRIVSFDRRHLAAISWKVSVEGAPVELVVVSHLTNHQDKGPHPRLDPSDPRQGKFIADNVLVAGDHEADERGAVMAYRTRVSGLSLGCGMDHLIASEVAVTVATEVEDDEARVRFAFRAEPGQTFELTKLLAYHTSAAADLPDLMQRVRHTLDEAAVVGFEALAAEQRDYLRAVWDIADIRIEGPARMQQAIRWNLFQLIQATERVEGTGVPAKGLTSNGYDGHYFWDMDMFFMPFLTYVRPAKAIELLRYRYSTLDEARRRAREMSQVGALFPWRTINGEEASAYFPAGTAQYHINAAVMYAVKRYVEVTGDQQFLVDLGAELVLATARLWLDLGFYGDDDAFHIFGVTGPDEYTAVVNDNTYTNLMAQLHLRYAADVVDWLAANHPLRHVELVESVGLIPGEVEEWRRAADHMVVLYDEERGINPQDTEFLDKEVWDFANTPPEDYPLLLHHHPLVLYRHQVLKQSDIVLAMVVRGDVFSPERKAANFAYYEPLTTNDSSLSVPIQLIIAAEVGEMEIAEQCFAQAAFADLADAYGNTVDGVHLASCGALWMSLVLGFGGMREYGGRLSFDPRLPRDWERVEFSLIVRGSRIDVDITHDEIGFLSHGSDELEVAVGGRDHQLRSGVRVTVGLRHSS
jgi:alpha,alpha-trehalose phosphorylase